MDIFLANMRKSLDEIERLTNEQWKKVLAEPQMVRVKPRVSVNAPPPYITFSSAGPGYHQAAFSDMTEEQLHSVVSSCLAGEDPSLTNGPSAMAELSRRAKK